MKNKKILIVIIIIVLVGSFCLIVFNSLDKNKISFRDTNDNLLMNGDVLVNKNPAKVGKDSVGNPVVLLKIKDTDVFYEVTEKVSHQNDMNSQSNTMVKTNSHIYPTKDVYL